MKRNMILYMTLPLLALGAARADAANPNETRSAEISVTQQALENAISLTDILDADVRAGDEQELGTLGDVLFGNDGKVREYLVEIDDVDAYVAADYDKPPSPDEEADLRLDYVAVPPEQMQFDGTTPKLDLGRTRIAGLQQRDHGISRPHSGIYASDLIGMDVDLTDAESFGSVDEVLLDPSGQRIVAYVVASQDGLDTQRHALPAGTASFRPDKEQQPFHENYEVAAIVFSFSREQVRDLPEFKTDGERENQWDWNFSLR